MNLTTTERVLQAMREQGLTQMILSDPVAIYYLTDRWIFPGERLLALYLNTNGNHCLVINELFPQQSDPDLRFVWYNDIQDGVEILRQQICATEPLGIDKTWRAGFLLHLQELHGAVSYVNGSEILDRVRQIKTQDEQEKMRISSRMNDEVMEELIPWVTKGLTEKELEQKACQIYQEHGFEDVSFTPITAYGKNAADPHHNNDSTLGSYGDCVVLDIGGMKDCYASDMTRTVFLGEASPKAVEIYNIVKEANLRGIAAAKPGARMRDVDLACRNYITEMGYGPYFTHRTGHSIGLEDHEAGDVSSVNEAIIHPGQCFSVEPGIYLPEEGIGVRIEDLVLITETGCEVLNHFTKDLIVVPMSPEQ